LVNQVHGCHSLQVMSICVAWKIDIVRLYHAVQGLLSCICKSLGSRIFVTVHESLLWIC
jgi:hypothetical protein